MNKTVTINLSGIVFHIDENAYELLRKYLERLKEHFSNTQGKEEIIVDIEGRMAEMFTEKNADVNRVIMQADVDEVINAMGKPEDLPGNEEEEVKSHAKSDQSMYYEGTKKRFFRNPDDKVLGGVCSGIASYFDIDPLWLRLAFVLLAILAFGTGLLIYIILWIIIPEAKTPSEKLQMRGERVNVANIEKNVREELESLKKRGENFASNLVSLQTNKRVRSAGQKVGDFIGDIFRALGKMIAIIFGIIITLLSICILIGLTIAVFAGIGVFHFALPHSLTNMVLTNSELWWLIIGALLAIGIPFTLLLLNGLKILFKVNLNLRMIGAVMAGLWLVGIGICVLEGIHIATDYQRSATVKETRMVSVPSDRLVLMSTKNSSEYNQMHDDFIQLGDMYILDENGDSVLNNNVRLDIQASENDSTYVIPTLYSRGRTYDEAKHLANEINYRFSVTDSIMLLPNYFIMSTRSKYRAQNVRLLIKVPVGKIVKLDKSIGGMLDNVANVSETWDWDMIGHEWKMTKAGLECLDCPKKDEELPGHEQTHVHISAGGTEIKVTTDDNQ